jgi:ABC-2 type transport system ATP-binding protein
VSHLQKTFKKTIKQPGLKAGFKSLFKPQIETFEAVKDLNFRDSKGEIFGFIGANGAGKSTTIKMLTGILTPTSGTCLINGKNPQKNRTAYVKDIGVVLVSEHNFGGILPYKKLIVCSRRFMTFQTRNFIKEWLF